MRYAMRDELIMMFMTALLALGIAKLLWSISLFWLPAEPFTPPISQNEVFIKGKVHLGEKFALHRKITPQRLAKSKEISRMHLKAIYKTGKEEFVLIETAKKTYMLEPGKSVQGYRLIEINRQFVVFEKGGKVYRLFLDGYQKQRKKQL